jgi:hypothetical protein
MLKHDSPNPSIGVVLTVHKRPRLLADQLTALRRQSIPATQIVIWDNNSGYDYTFPLQPNESVVWCTRNWGVWPRFLMAACLRTDYVCVYDDDTMPGHDWHLNCLNTINQLPPFSLLGAVGVLFPDGSRENRDYVGWKSPTDRIVHADIVGHSWFCERKLLDWFVVDHRCPDTCGEDYHLSARAREKGGVVACPPHPVDRPSLWGSLRGSQLGDDEVALWRQPGEEEKKRAAHERLRASGWKVATEIYQ